MRPIVLSGFMETGKSTVGRMLAAHGATVIDAESSREASRSFRTGSLSESSFAPPYGAKRMILLNVKVQRGHFSVIALTSLKTSLAGATSALAMSQQLREAPELFALWTSEGRLA